MNNPSDVVNQESKKRLPVSSFLVCKNEEAHIEECLKSLDFCDEIIVVDSYSTDRTLEICKKFNVKLIQREWPGYKIQKEFACNQTKNDWVLFMDADEVVSYELRAKILELISNPNDVRLKKYSAFRIKRVMFYLGKWWRKGGWYPEYRIRFFKRNKVQWVGAEPHENLNVNGNIGELEGEILHYSYEDIPDQVKKLSSHAFTRAKFDYDFGKRATFYDILAKPPARFLKFYFVKKGFLEGSAGFIVAILESFYTYMKYARLWELERIDKQNKN